MRSRKESRIFMKYVVMQLPEYGKVKSVGIDFDGTIVKVNDNLPTSQCKIMPGARETLQRFKDEGWTIVIDTCRKDTKGVKKLLEKNKIPFNYINENPAQDFMSSLRKTYTDVRLDDKAVTFRSWKTAYKDVIKRRKELDAMRVEGRVVL